MLSSPRYRVPHHLEGKLNERALREIEANIAKYANAEPWEVENRILQLEREWSIERYLEANAAGLGLLGAVLSVAVNRKWLALTSIVTGFLMEQALTNWSPPTVFMRRLGYRTQTEINYERYALKTLRGDFRKVSVRKNRIEDVERLMAAVEE